MKTLIRPLRPILIILSLVAFASARSTARAQTLLGDVPGLLELAKEGVLNPVDVQGVDVTPVGAGLQARHPSLPAEGASKRRYIFIDGGAHRGESIATFVQSDLYKQHAWEMFAFEANPNLIPHIPKMPNLTVLGKAIWIHGRGVEFYLGENTLGSSIIKNKKSGGLSKIPTKVESVDFGPWLKANFALDDYILVKLDIEGAEYDVLDKMLAEGDIKYVDELLVEFHNRKVHVSRRRDKKLIEKMTRLGIIVDSSGSAGAGHWRFRSSSPTDPGR